jgi:hypothetical protein
MLAFRHGLVHQTLYQGMPASLRAALHSQAAESLARAGVVAERLAGQLLAGQLLAVPREADAWMIDWVADAAPVLSRRAPRVAVELLERARDALGWQDPRREHLDTDLAMARLMLGDNEQVVGLARPVLAGTRDPALAGRAAWTLGYGLPRLGRPTPGPASRSRAPSPDRSTASPASLVEPLARADRRVGWSWPGQVTASCGLPHRPHAFPLGDRITALPISAIWAAQ